MSKDIRSFFTVKGSTTYQKKTSPNQKNNITKTKRKRAAFVISDSESDEETKKTSFSKRNKPSDNVSEKQPKHDKKQDDSTISSKYFTSKTVDPGTIFASRPVKRNNSRNIIKKTEEKSEEFHIDKDFESELLQFDDVISDALLSNESQNNKIVHETPNQCLETNGLTETSGNVNEKSKRAKLDNNKDREKREEKKTFSDTGLLKLNCASKSPESKKQNHSLVITSPLKHSSVSSESPPKSVSTKRTDSTPNTCNKDAKATTTYLHKNKKNTSSKSKHIESDYNKSLPSESDNQSFKESPSKEKCFITDIQKEVCNLWVDKYKPASTKQIIGQQGEKSCVNKLVNWLRNWHTNNSYNKKSVKPSPWAKNDNGAYFKAALLSGPPGVGKTTTAHIVAKELGFDLVEFNASDTRSKKLLHQEVSELLSTNSLTPFFSGNEAEVAVTKKHVLLMDEVDGMAGNEDRGGLQELISLIKQSKIPIVCMCNDRNHPKIRSLANYCFDLRFFKPRAEQIRGAMMSICFKENLKMKPDALTDIITSANQDIRLIINHLSMLAVENSNLAKSTKYVKLGPWDILRKIFTKEEHKGMSIHDKCDLFFHDYSVTPLFVQDNYLNVIPHHPNGKNKIKKMQLFAAAARSLSLGDLTERSIRSHNAWGLLPVQAVFSSYIPGEILEGHIGAQINFPAWFGKNSRQTKMNRLLQDLTIHSRLKISGNKEAMNLDYLTPLEESIVSPLVREGSDGISQSLAVLSEYCLVREDLESLSELSTWPNCRNRFSEVESKVKAAFTRAYNKTSAPTPYAGVPIRKAGKADVVDCFTGEEEEENVLFDEEENKEDELEVDAMIVKKKPLLSKTEKEAGTYAKGNKNLKRGRKK